MIPTTAKGQKRKSIFLLVTAYRKALKHGYKTGERVFGGSYFMSKKALLDSDKMKHLPDNCLQTVNLEEDHIFSNN